MGPQGNFGVVTHRTAVSSRSPRPTDRDALDDYVEAQVHRPVRLRPGVEAVVLDPCHEGTETGETAAKALPLFRPVEWHSGFRLGVEELRRHPGYRGQEYVDLGTQIAVDGMLDPRIVGDAARAGFYDPQAVKKVWHYLARFGARWKATDTSVAPAPMEGAVLDGLR